MVERNAKRAMLSEAEDFLIRVSAGQDPVTFMSAALTALGGVAVAIDVAFEFPNEARRLSALIAECTPALARAVAAETPSSEVEFAMSAAVDLLQPGHQADRNSNMIVVGLLKLELTRLVLRAQLRSANQRFARAVPSLLETKPCSIQTAYRN